MRPSVLAVALLLALPATLAAGSSLTALRVDLQADAVGGSPVLLVRDASAGTPAFRLTAEALRVETDARDVQSGAGVGLGTDPRTTVEEHRTARADGLSVGTTARLFVVPAEGSTVLLEAANGCSRVLPPTASSHRHAPRVGGRPSLEVPLGDAVAWSPCTDAAVTLRGDLLVVLWDWDARLASDRGTTVLDGGGGEAAEGDVGAREHFLFARNATLTLPPARQTVYVDDLAATAASVRLSEADGELDGARVDGDLLLSGRVGLLVRGSGPDRPLLVGVDGAVERALLDGVVLAPHRDGAPWWPWLLAAGLGVGGVGLVRARPHLHYLHAERTGGELGSLIPQTLRQRRAVGLWIMARSAEGRRRYRACRRRATKANDLFRPFPEAQFTRAVAAGALGQHADAMTDFIDLYHRYDEPMGRAAAACGMAQQCCRLGKWDGGAEWLRLAAVESFAYAHQAALSMDFDRYVGEPWFDALRRGEPAASVGSPADPSIQ